MPVRLRQRAPGSPTAAEGTPGLSGAGISAAARAAARAARRTLLGLLACAAVFPWVLRYRLQPDHDSMPWSVEQMATLGIPKIFIQPGAESPAILALCEEKGISVFQGCVMVEMGAPH